MELCISAKVVGRVQGVWFRRATQEQAERMNIRGWVRNTKQGEVEVLALGTPQAIRQFEAWLSCGPELANVAEVRVEIIDAQSIEYPLSGFEIRRTSK